MRDKADKAAQTRPVGSDRANWPLARTSGLKKNVWV